MTRARDLNAVRQRREELDLQLREVRDRVVARTARIKCGVAMLSMIEGGFVPHARTQQAIAVALDSTREELFPSEFEA